MKRRSVERFSEFNPLDYINSAEDLRLFIEAWEAESHARTLPTKIEFIKDLRAHTGASLKDAVHYADVHPEAWRPLERVSQGDK